MPDFADGVASYVTGVAVIKVHFPVDFKGNKGITCKHCPFLASNNRICQLNKQVVHYPEKFVGNHCPLEEIESEE